MWEVPGDMNLEKRWLSVFKMRIQGNVRLDKVITRLMYGDCWLLFIIYKDCLAVTDPVNNRIFLLKRSDSSLLKHLFHGCFRKFI